MLDKGSGLRAHGLWPESPLSADSNSFWPEPSAQSPNVIRRIVTLQASMIELVIHSRRRDLGGFEVGRVLPWTKRRMVGPFIFFDHIGPVQLPPDLPKSADVRPHPHIGLSTVTYLFAGEMVHRDSVGCHQVIRPGEVNWMTAGRGIAHSERFDTIRERGGLLHGIQAWIALPTEKEEIDPGFVHFGVQELPQISSGGVSIRVIAGAAFGASSPVPIHSPLFYAHAEMQTGSPTRTTRKLHGKGSVHCARRSAGRRADVRGWRADRLRARRAR